MEPQPLAAAVAWFALGAVFIGTAVLVLFNPRSTSVRWYAVFWVAIMAWLAAQGWAFAIGDWTAARRVVAVSTHLAPGLLLAYALREAEWWPRLLPWLAVGAALALLPLQLRTWDAPYSVPLLIAWNSGAWILATAVFIVAVFPRSRPGPAGRILWWFVIGGLVIVLPIGLGGAILTGGRTTVFVLPLLMVWIHILTFIGVVRLRFYDIEVRASRTGEIAAGAAEAERLAVVGELAASLAHEIRNPLTGVRSLAQRLSEEEIESGKRRRYAGVILEEIGRVERLVTDLLGIARRPPPGAAAETWTTVSSLFDDLVLLLGARAERAGARLTADAGGVTARVPREPLAQALLNLGMNAIAHTPSGGTVRLLARQEGEAIELLVRDSGPGIPPGERERVWEPFRSGGTGTGLGLAVVRRLARERGWEATVGEAPGGGAELRMVIPAEAGVERGTLAAARS